MKKIYYYITLSLILISCEKVIHVDLNEANPRIVVDAQLVDQGDSIGIATVRLTWSAGFYDDNNFKPIENAKINITDPRGHVYTFYESEQGVYINSTAYNVFLNDEFTLDIVAEDETITAKSTMPRRVEIDSLTFAPFVFGPHKGGSFVVQCHFMDPPNEDNYYYLKLYINDTLQSGYYIGSDDAIDGRRVDYVFYQNWIVYQSFVQVELYTIDEAAYEYFKVLYYDESSGGMSAAPGNPISNIEGNAIGIFRASAMDKQHIIVPDFIQ